MSALTNSAVRLLPLSGQRTSIVDADLFDWLNQWSWHLSPGRSTSYAQRCDRSGGHPVTIKLHRVILGAPDGIQVDHINRDGLDNRRANLRLAEPFQNCANRFYPPPKSGFRGVHQQCSGRWVALARCRGKRVCAGTHDTREQAAAAYDAMARDLFGEFAVLNFPEAA